MHVPIEAGCILVRSAEDYRRPFAAHADYLTVLERGITPEGAWWADYGPQLTRGFRALKSWFVLRVDGVDKLGRLAARNVRQARALEAMIRAHPRLELLASGPLSVLCLRYRPDAGFDSDGGTAAPEGEDAPWNAEALDRFNTELLADVQESGVAAVSGTRIGGAFCLRLAITNHRTRDEDLKLFVDTVAELGSERAAAASQAAR